jgi:hypothetical protein
MRHVQMVRRHWREPEFWRWWWRTGAPGGVRIGTMLVLLGVLLAAGLLAAGRLSASNGKTPLPETVRVVTTVESVVTVHEQGKVVRKIVPVVKRVYRKPRTVVRATTAFQTRTVYVTVPYTTPGLTRTVTRTFVQRASAPAPTQVVVVRTKTETVVQQLLQTVTLTKTVTQPPVTVTVRPGP